MKKKNVENTQQFEICKVCKVNHNQGRKHMYLPHHKKSLSTLLSRFQSKLCDVRLMLKNPNPILEHASRNRLWCVFCDLDIPDLDCGFACGNAITHFASEQHLKNVKAFFWKHGGGMERVNTFCISDDDFSKWQRKCELRKNDEESQEILIGPTNDIHNINTVAISNLNSFNHNVSNNVLPLQNDTNEKYEISSSMVTRINLIGERKGNVHSGAPPPWFNNEESLVIASTLPSRSSLNPKRVGAAWAEKRKIELELESKGKGKGEKTYNPNWLPNFGGVWETKTRKESRKHFNTLQHQKTQTLELQPYISKRKRPNISPG